MALTLLIGIGEQRARSGKGSAGVGSREVYGVWGAGRGDRHFCEGLVDWVVSKCLSSVRLG